MSRFTDALEYGLLRGAIALTGCVPRRWALSMGAVLGELVYRLVRIRRRVVEENLASTLGQFAPRGELSRIARGVYHHLGRTLVEYGRLRRLDRARVEQLVEVTGLEHLERAHAAGLGVIILTGHFGNWELLGAAITLRGYPLHFLARPQKNQRVEQFLERTRGKLAVGLVHTGGAGMREAFRLLRRGELLGILADQDAGQGGVFLDVLGRPASVQSGAAEIAARTGAWLLPSYIVRRADGRHQVFIEPPLIPEQSADQTVEVDRLLRAGVASLERFVLRFPAQWYWVHRRWKTTRAQN